MAAGGPRCRLMFAFAIGIRDNAGGYVRAWVTRGERETFFQASMGQLMRFAGVRLSLRLPNLEQIKKWSKLPHHHDVFYHQVHLTLLNDQPKRTNCSCFLTQSFFACSLRTS